jgi:hypothetical protein
VKAEITNILPVAKGKTHAADYYRVTFRLEDGSWAKTDLCPTFRNYARWKPLLRVGQGLDGLKLRRPGEIDGDSRPVACQPPPRPAPVRRERKPAPAPEPQMELSL